MWQHPPQVQPLQSQPTDSHTYGGHDCVFISFNEHEFHSEGPCYGASRKLKYKQCQDSNPSKGHTRTQGNPQMGRAHCSSASLFSTDICRVLDYKDFSSLVPLSVSVPRVAVRILINTERVPRIQYPAADFLPEVLSASQGTTGEHEVSLLTNSSPLPAGRAHVPAPSLPRSMPLLSSCCPRRHLGKLHPAPSTSHTPWSHSESASTSLRWSGHSTYFMELLEH